MEKTYLYSDYDVAENAVEEEKNINSKNENVGYKQVVFDKKNYLNTKLADGEASKTLVIRLLPFPDTRTPFLHIHMHTLKVPKEISDSGWKSYVCLEKTQGLNTEVLGTKCPFCEAAKESYKKAKAEKDEVKNKILRDEGKKNLPEEYVVMRCIERGKEDEGVKFWKTKVHQDKGDPYNLICTLAETRKAEWLADKDNQGKDTKESNILSINDYGYDLIITMKKEMKTNKEGKSVEKTSYQVTDAKKPSPLSMDPEQVKNWVMDEKKWFEVFVPKPYEYLAIVKDGNLPWYDREQKKWVSKKDAEEKKNAEIAEADEKIKQAQEASVGAMVPKVEERKVEEPVVQSTPEDDLPF